MASNLITLNLDYSPPLDWRFFLEYLLGRMTVGVETVRNGCYTRAIEIGGDTGTFNVIHAADRHQLAVSINGQVARHADAIGARVRQIFDLDADPTAIRAVLSADPRLGTLVAARPGIRVPGAWSMFELLIRTIVGQQVSVKAATTVMGRIATRLGREVVGSHGESLRLFPEPAVLADSELSSIGMPGTRVRAVRAVARAVADKMLDFTIRDQSAVRAALLALPGIGPWTVEYFALRGLRDPDAWPGSDLVLKRAVGESRRGDRPAEKWRPYRAYAAMYLWSASVS